MTTPLKQVSSAVFAILPTLLPAEGGIRFDNLNPTYDGTARYPIVSLDGVERTALFACRRINPDDSPPVFSNIPSTIALSYSSLSFAAQQTSELGNLVQAAGTGRVADYMEAVMVTWAPASKYPEWSARDPTGYRHPVSARIYQIRVGPNGENTLQILDESTVHVHIPWKPAVLPDGSAYPYNGYGFKVLIPFSARVGLPDSFLIAIGYNTQSSGISPIGDPGPYNELNLALSSTKPRIGVDPDPSSVLWGKGGKYYYPAVGWGGVGSPMFALAARPVALPTPVLTTGATPVHAGIYHLNATLTSPSMEAGTVLCISKALARITAEGLKKSVTDPVGGPLITTVPPDLPVEITYNGSTTPPMIPGTHPFSVRVVAEDHQGSFGGNFVLTAERYGQWTERALPGLAASLVHGQADPDSDGLPNWFEYATGSDPLKAESGPIPVRSSSGMKLSFSQRRGLDGINLVPEFSTNLQTWTPAESQSDNAGDFWETRSVSSSTIRGFFRFRVGESISW